MLRLTIFLALLYLTTAGTGIATSCSSFSDLMPPENAQVNNEATDFRVTCDQPKACDIHWFYNGKIMTFTNGIADISPLIRRRSRSLRLLRVHRKLAGTFACVLASAQPNCSSTQPQSHPLPLSCYPGNAVRVIRLSVDNFVQPSKRPLLPLYPPDTKRQMKVGHLYLSRLFEEAQSPTREMNSQEPVAFKVHFLVYKSRSVPRVSWYMIKDRQNDVLDMLYYTAEAPERRDCELMDTTFDDNSGVRCYTARLHIGAVRPLTVGQYACDIVLGEQKLELKAFRLDSASRIFDRATSAAGKSTQKLTMTFNRNFTGCSGSSLQLVCTVTPANVNATIVKISQNSTRVLRFFSHQMMEINGTRVAVRSVNGDSVKLEVTLTNIQVKDGGVYACSAKVDRKGSVAVMKQATITVTQECVSSFTVAIVAVAISLAVSAVICLLICCVCLSRRRNSPIVKKVRVIHSRNEQLYKRTRTGSGTAPLLSGRLNRLDSQDSTQSQTFVPDVVVERVGRGHERGDTTNEKREVRYIIPKCPVMEVDRRNVYFCKKIGEGAFGSVYSGQIHCGNGTVDVAIKRLKQDYTEEELIAIVKEMEVMKVMAATGMQHPNIIRMLGVCTKKGPFLLLTELALLGNLRDFLRERQPMTPVDSTGYGNLKPGSMEVMVMPVVTQWQLLQFCIDVADAMKFLADKGIVHRDLAARNVLVSRAEIGCGVVAKVGDFGLTRNVEEKEYYRMLTEGKLPVKWLAPECLTQRVFSEKSDVWAFGILMYEIFSYGEVPYPGVSPDRVHEIVRKGERNRRPELASESVYSVMCQCWSLQSEARPSFAEVEEKLRKL